MCEKIYIFGTIALAAFVGYVGMTAPDAKHGEVGAVLMLFAVGILLFILVQLVADRVLPKDEG